MARSSIRKRLWAYQANCEPITVNPGLSSTWVQFQSTGNWLLKNVECRVQISRILKIFEGGYVLVATSWTITQHRVQLLSKENICSLHQQTTFKKKKHQPTLWVSHFCRAVFDVQSYSEKEAHLHQPSLSARKVQGWLSNGHPRWWKPTDDTSLYHKSKTWNMKQLIIKYLRAVLQNHGILNFPWSFFMIDDVAHIFRTSETDHNHDHCHGSWALLTISRTERWNCSHRGPNDAPISGHFTGTSFHRDGHLSSTRHHGALLRHLKNTP